MVTRTLRIAWAFWATFAASALSGCFFFGDAPTPPPPPLPPDLSLPVGRDMNVPPPVDIGAPADLSAPTDLPAPADLASAPTDLLRDLAVADGPPCRGGYLNSNDPAACPLRCGAGVEPVADEGAFHVPYCTKVAYKHNPPATGDHWPWTAPWGVYKDVVPREWFLHNLEHQGVVLLYNCPYPKGDGGQKMANVYGAQVCATDGGVSYPQQYPAVDNCAAEIAELEKIYMNHPADNFWDQYFVVRIMVTQDPLLPTRFGAVAWGWSWLSNQLDLAALKCFIESRYGRGPEAAP